MSPRQKDGRLIAVDIDDASIAPASRVVAGERGTAMRDLVADNLFTPAGHRGGSYRLHLSVVDQRLVLAVTAADGTPVATHALSLTPLRRVVRDYLLICDSYRAALATAAPARIEAIDMGRRGLHDEGAGILRARLDGKIVIDHATARRLFTLVVALHWKE